MTEEIIKRIFVAFIIGFIVEKIVSFFWSYNPPLATFYGVPILIVVFWTVLLPLSYEIRNRVLKNRTFTNQLILIIVGIYIVELIGSNILNLKLNIASQFPSLLPSCCNAPLVIYVIYIIIVNEYWRLLDRKPSLLLFQFK
jgi:MFS superfamily sulfate permease-like transporter|tara:strand:- start:12781 stop:13203 length:423 start_codon:yes stop_codon:yes gene_type:complete